MNCIKNIQNLVIGKVIELQEQNANVLNRPETKKTYIICPSAENPYSEKIIMSNLGNVRSLYDGSFAEYYDIYNYIATPEKKNFINTVPFIVALKSNKEILPVYVSDSDPLIISYCQPFEVSDCYDDFGRFDYDKINAYVERWKTSIEISKKEIQKVKKYPKML